MLKKTILFFTFLLITQVGFSQKNKGNKGGKSAQKHKNHHMKMEKLRHVVLFKFKDSSTPDDIKAIEEAFRNLPKKISQIKGYEWGLNNSPEGINQGFTHCFFLTFDSEADRAIYLPHPDHKAFGSVLGPHLDKVLVVDYWTKD